MSKYTTELRYICESLVGLTESADSSQVNDIITKAAPLIFNFKFPIHDESHRLELETKILKHYYTREIGAETYGRWQLFLDEKLNTIMPYYNQLYASAELEFNPLVDYKVTKSGNSNITTKANSTSRNLFSDTPQGSLQNVDNETYLSSASKDMLENGGNSDNNYSETTEGLAGGRSYSALLKEYRKTILNIDSMIVDELSDLFMNIW